MPNVIKMLALFGVGLLLAFFRHQLIN